MADGGCQQEVIWETSPRRIRADGVRGARDNVKCAHKTAVDGDPCGGPLRAGQHAFSETDQRSGLATEMDRHRKLLGDRNKRTDEARHPVQRVPKAQRKNP